MMNISLLKKNLRQKIRTPLLWWGCLIGLSVLSLGHFLLYQTSTRVVASAEPVTALEKSYDHLIWSLPEPLEQYADVPLAPGEVLVGFYEDQVAAAGVLAGLEIVSVEEMDLQNFETDSGRILIGKHLFVPVGKEWDTIAQLMEQPSVAFAAPNWLVRAATKPDRTDIETETKIDAATEVSPGKAYIEQIQSVNDPDYRKDQWYLQRINFQRAWDLVPEQTSDLSTIRVAIIDSGIDVIHPEFEGRLTNGVNFLDFDNRPEDDYGHGTHVAGLLGAAINNDEGIAGVAPRALIDTYKVLDEYGGGSIRNVADAIDAATSNGAKIINLSLEARQSHPLMQNSVEKAAKTGVLLIAASGNFNTNVAYPASYPDVMAIASTGYRDARANYSNYGEEIELSAPGGGEFEGYLDGVYSDQHEMLIHSTWPGGVFCDKWRGVPPESSYCSTEGTSMSAALVTGAAALIWSISPHLNADEVRQILIDSATPLPDASATELGAGLLDVHRAARMALRSNLNILETEKLSLSARTDTLPYSTTLTLQNESLQKLDWQATYDASQDWLQIQDAVIQTNTWITDAEIPAGKVDQTEIITSVIGNLGGNNVSYGQPDRLTLVVSPTDLTPGKYSVPLNFSVQRPDTTHYTETLNLDLTVTSNAELKHHFYLPIIAANHPLAEVLPASYYRWEAPVHSEKIPQAMIDDNNISVSLPITYNGIHKKVQIYSDGFIIFSKTENVEMVKKNLCLPQTGGPDNAIYGWWADLDPSRNDGKVYTFQSDSDRFVIEFENVSTAAGVIPAYQVTFQIVFYEDGRIQLNYRNIPEFVETMPQVTIGAEMEDGLFYNQVFCYDGTAELGRIPEMEQTILLEPKELY